MSVISITENDTSNEKLKNELGNIINKIENNTENKIIVLPKNREEAEKHEFKFWGKQDVLQLNKYATVPKMCNSEVIPAESQQKMHEPYEWARYDIMNETEMNRVVSFINMQYNDGNNNKYVQVYTVKYLRWLLADSPIIIGVRAKTGGNIGAISCIKTNEMQLYNKRHNTASVEIFCVHKKLRQKGVAELLMNETKRVVLSERDIKIGKFMTQVYVPTPVCKIEYYHRPINYGKLNRLNYVSIKSDTNNQTVGESFMISTKNTACEKLTESNIEKAYELLCEYQDKYNIYERYTLEKFVKTFYDNEEISSYVLLDNNKNIIDFVSYSKFILRDRDVKTEDLTNENTIRVAKMHTYTSNTMTPLMIYKNTVISANNEGIDLFTTTDMMENLEILYDNFSRFTKGNISLYVNFYNWECKEISPEQLYIYA